MEPDGAAEIVDREPESIDAELREEPVEHAGEELEAVPDAERLVRVAEARKIERDDAIRARDRSP